MWMMRIIRLELQSLKHFLLILKSIFNKWQIKGKIRKIFSIKNYGTATLIPQKMYSLSKILKIKMKNKKTIFLLNLKICYKSRNFLMIMMAHFKQFLIKVHKGENMIVSLTHLIAKKKKNLSFHLKKQSHAKYAMLTIMTQF